MLDKTKLPKHVALICDGNRRWAKAKGLPTLQGHKKGYDRANEIVQEAWDIGVQTITIWVFSTENWDRTKVEVDYLMDLFISATKNHLEIAFKNEARVIHLGRKDRISPSLAAKITDVEQKTAHFTKRFLAIALDYGGRDELLRAIKKSNDDGCDMSSLESETIDKYLDTCVLPQQSPDMIIRTSGEYRLSGYLLWQCAYSELFFVPVTFPDFTKEELRKCIEDFQTRQRRFGK